MKVGELYTLSKRGQYHTFGTWKGEIALYLGESVINRSDGVVIVNHAFMINGERRITDRSFTSMLEPLTSS